MSAHSEDLATVHGNLLLTHLAVSEIGLDCSTFSSAQTEVLSVGCVYSGCLALTNWH